VRTAVAAACLALVIVGAAAAADGGSSTYTVSQRTYYFTLFNSGTTGIENSAHCVPGQPDGIANEIECGPLTTAVSTHVGFVATLAAPVACGAPFQFEVSSNGATSFTRVGDATLTGSCTAAAPEALAPPAVRGTPTVGRTLTATPPTWSATPARVAYQWQLCTRSGCVPIRGATSLSLKLTKRAAGHTVRVVATATFDGSQIASASRRIGVRGS